VSCSLDQNIAVESLLPDSQTVEHRSTFQIWRFLCSRSWPCWHWPLWLSTGFFSTQRCCLLCHRYPTHILPLRFRKHGFSGVVTGEETIELRLRPIRDTDPLYEWHQMSCRSIVSMVVFVPCMLGASRSMVSHTHYSHGHVVTVDFLSISDNISCYNCTHGYR
jgi:hypothetical protein